MVQADSLDYQSGRLTLAYPTFWRYSTAFISEPASVGLPCLLNRSRQIFSGCVTFARAPLSLGPT